MSRRLLLGMVFIFSIVASAECQEREETKQPTLRPRLAECTLSIAGVTLKPARVIESWHYQYPAGAMGISIEGQTVVASDAKTGKIAWKVPSPDGWSLEWLTADERIAYFRAVKVGRDKDEGKPPQYEQPARVRRLQLQNHEWLTSLEVTSEKAKQEQQGQSEEKTTEVVAAALPHERGTIILTVTVVDGSLDEAVESYRITGFLPGKDTPAWSRDYPSAGNRSHPGAWLLSAARRPDYAAEAVEPLVAVGTNVLVCAGSLEEMICLEMEGGKEVWRVPRVWEFRRGFIGPSVWTHYIGRYGMEDLDVKAALEGPEKGQKIAPEYLEELKKAVNDAKARIETEENASIAGPVVVPAGKGLDDEAKYSIFVAVARSQKSPLSGYLSDCVVYELDESGNPIGIATLPRMVNGWQSCADERGLIWACPRNAFVKLIPSEDREEMGQMLGGADMVCHIAWYCQPSSLPSPKAWLTADPAGDPVAFCRTDAFRLTGESYILKADDNVYHFPICRLNLQTAQSQPLLLHVPFDGKVDLPSTNYSQAEGTTHTMGPYLLGVTWLEVHGDALQIVLGMEDAGACAVEFDLAGV